MIFLWGTHESVLCARQGLWRFPRFFGLQVQCAHRDVPTRRSVVARILIECLNYHSRMFRASSSLFSRSSIHDCCTQFVPSVERYIPNTMFLSQPQ